jgi:hypothetical protein
MHSSVILNKKWHKYAGLPSQKLLKSIILLQAFLLRKLDVFEIRKIKKMRM